MKHKTPGRRLLLLLLGLVLLVVAAFAAIHWMEANLSYTDESIEIEVIPSPN